MITFENRDCMEAMKEFPDKFFDLAIVDPPYGAGFTEGGGCQGWFAKYHQNGGGRTRPRFGGMFQSSINGQPTRTGTLRKQRKSLREIQENAGRMEHNTVFLDNPSSNSGGGQAEQGERGHLNTAKKS